jgi:L-histidine N-alpha-methyltransferase
MAAAPALLSPVSRPREGRAALAAEIRAGLAGWPRSLPTRYLYDDRGSALFEAITRVPEYYQTRTEEALLARLAGDLVAETLPDELVELGSGAGRKVGLLLGALVRATRPAALTLFDINATFARSSAARLAAAWPGLRARAIVGDFTGDLTELEPGVRRLVILFGGTLGNLAPPVVPGFLRRVARRAGPGSHFLVGVDTVKDPARLEAAYNDAAGVTAEFNRNILRHVNAVAGTDFDPRRFRHRAYWDPERRWIEMRLVAVVPSRVRIPDGRPDVRFRAGDEVRTEISCKYDRRTFGELLPGTGFTLARWETDPEGLFALALLRRDA